MEYSKAKQYDHFAYPIPFQRELDELGLRPYRTNSELERKIQQVFTSSKFKWSQLFIDVSTSGSRMLVRDMGKVGVSMVRYFLAHPQQFGHNMENIHLQLLVRMWKQTFRHCKFQEKELDRYMSTTLKSVSVENGLLEEFIRTVEQGDFIQSDDDMVKRRENKALREHAPASLREGDKHFERLVRIAENESGSLL